MLQFTMSHGDMSGDGDTTTREVVNGKTMVMSMSVAVGTRKKSVSETLISGEVWTASAEVVRGISSTGEEVKGRKMSSEVVS